LVVLAACGGHDASDERAPSAAEIVGTYDLTATFHDTRSIERGVGTLRVDDEIDASLTVPPVALHGTLAADGTVTLTGITTNSDAVQPVEGRGTIAVVDGISRFVADITGSGMDNVSIVMERPVGADARTAAGSYQIELTPSPSGCDCTSRIDFAAAFDTGGYASIAGSSEAADDDARVLATLPFGSLVLAPSGLFHLSASYEPVAGSRAGLGCGGGSCQLEIDGELPAAAGDVPGTGSFTELTSLRFVGATGTIETRRSE
jgi:hypothetical protein